MTLESGTKLGPYELIEQLGAGGMGVVFKARDTRLDRVVALKILAPAMAADAQFRERFEREARTISQLTDPHICTVYDVGEVPDPTPAPGQPATIRYLVMEFIEGETLAARLERGRLDLEDALKVASEISSALDRAHRAGVVHRDLKPGNIMLTKSGAKLLDFGLARQSHSAVIGADGAIMPIATSAAITAQGVIVGTFQYMAPEQLEGAEPDARADIFAFGAILYEMVTGRKAFEGKNAVSLIGAILKDEPPPIASLVPVAPAWLDRIIHACLAKDPDARLRSTHDLVLQLQWLAEGRRTPETAAEPAVLPRASTSPLTWVLGAALAAALVAIAVLALRGSTAVQRTAGDPIQFLMPAPENSAFSGGGGLPQFAVSPDGRQVAFVAATPGGGSSLFLRPMGSATARVLPATDQATYPFFSFDSQTIGFFSMGKLKKLSIAGGSPIVVADAPAGRGGAWNADNVIVFAGTLNGPLTRVSASGGATAPATTVDGGHGETAHRWPAFLPDGRHFLYFSLGPGQQQPSQVKVAALDSTETTTLMAAESTATYASGHVFFWRDAGIMAQPFDPVSRQTHGDPFRVAEPVGQGGGYATFSISQTGVMVTARGGARPKSQITWIDRSGKQLGTISEPGDYYNVMLAPDERRVAVSVEPTPQAGTPVNRDIWVIDTARNVSSRLTFDPTIDFLPTWSPDGLRLLFGSGRVASGLFMKSVSGGPEELIAKVDDLTMYPLDWSRDGKFVIYALQPPATDFDLWVLPMTGEPAQRKPIPFAQTPFAENHGTFAPDSRWIAYTSNESGREEVYVQPFPPTGDKIRISKDGGTEPAWRGDGRELFFLAPDANMMSASISETPKFDTGVPQVLFPSGVAFTNNRRQYSVTRDGQKFLVNVQQQGSSPTPLTVTVNWKAPEVKK